VINPSGERLMIELARPEKSGFAVRSIEGLGPVKANIVTTDLANNDGAVFNSARLSYRNIILDLGFYEVYDDIVDDDPVVSSGGWTIGRRSFDTSRNSNGRNNLVRQELSLDIEDIRQRSYLYFPIKKDITLIFYTSNRTVYIKGYVESNEPSIFSYEEGTSISIVCPYPYFRELSNDQVINFSQVDPLFKFAFSSTAQPQLNMSQVSTIVEQDIFYDGEIKTGVVIDIFLSGRIGDLTIYNASLAQTFALNASKIESIIGGQISAGDRIVISSIERDKFITYFKGVDEYNILGAKAKNSTWLGLDHGDNVYTYSVSSGDEYVSFQVSYPVLYEGI